MSYCRWSTDCDVYAYEDVSGGYTVHIGNAAARLNYPRVEARANLDTLEEFYEYMVLLRELGLKFPDYVLDWLKEEMEDETTD